MSSTPWEDVVGWISLGADCLLIVLNLPPFFSVVVGTHFNRELFYSSTMQLRCLCGCFYLHAVPMGVVLLFDNKI
jgi:hypothetical protein